MTLVLSQGLLFVADHRIQPRDKQLLRRELGAELVSFQSKIPKGRLFLKVLGDMVSIERSPNAFG